METDRLSRRGFIEAAGLAVGGVVLAACAPTEETPTAYPQTDFPKPTATLRLTETPKPSPTATEVVPYQLEDGTQMERVEQGKLVDLFPGSEVFMSERGDAVIINRETGLKLAGQVVENKYGSYTLLFGESYYQYLYGHWRNGEATSLGGYPNVAESPLKEEIGRILSTLLELRNKEVGFSDLSTHQPKEKHLTAIFMNMGGASIIESSLEEGLLNIDELKKISNIELAFPPQELGQDSLLTVRFFLASGTLTSFPDEGLPVDLSRHIPRTFENLIRQAAIANGINQDFLFKGYVDGIKVSVFSGLFANDEIDGAFGAFNRLDWEPAERVRRAKWGVPSIVEVDFSKFTNTP